jgi:hypothetical protein
MRVQRMRWNGQDDVPALRWYRGGMSQTCGNRIDDRLDRINGTICRMKKVIKILCAALFTATVTAAIIGSPVYAARMAPVSASVPETNSNLPDDLRLPDPHKDLRQLSKDLKLTKDQQDVIGSILEERKREIQLLLDVKALSQDFRDMLAAIVMNNSNAQIESLLRSKQKTKFDQELMQAQRLR